MDDATKQTTPSSIDSILGPGAARGPMPPVPQHRNAHGFINVLVLFLVLLGAASVVFNLRGAPLGPPPTDKPSPDSTAPSDNASLLGLEDILLLTDVPSRLDFGKQMTGTTSGVQTVTLVAKKDISERITVETPSNGDFSALPADCDLNPSAPCALTITFTPKHIQKIASFLKITAAPLIVNSSSASGAPANPGAPSNSAMGDPPPDISGSGVILLMGEGTASYPATGPAFPEHDWFLSKLPILLVVLLFLLGLTFIRWNMVAVPTRRWALASTEAVRARVETLSDAKNPAREPINKLLSTASDLITCRNQSSTDRLADYIFWNRGQEITAWLYIHEAEEQLVAILSEASVRASLERAESDLLQAATPSALALAGKIHEALVATPALSVDVCRTLLTELLSFFTPLKSDLGDRAARALEPNSAATADDCRKILQDAVTALVPTDVANLADQIDKALKDSESTVSTLTPLLQKASSLLDPRAATTLAAKVQAALAAPAATVEQVKTILSEIRDYFQPEAAALADKIRSALVVKPAVPIERWRALLYESLGLLYDRADSKFAAMLSWHNKTVYLVGCGLLLIISMGAALGHETLFLMGAAGGLLSRLTRTLYREDVPTDYGASWTTLFLSPVVGALMGWAGVLLVILGTQFNVLGSALKVDWYNPTAPVALALAFMLGFSERAFTGILSQLDAKTQASAAASAPSAGTVLSITTSSILPPGKAGEKYAQSLAAAGGTPPYTWRTISGQLPAGLNLDSSGAINGTPTTAGVAAFTVQVKDAAARTNSQAFSVAVS